MSTVTKSYVSSNILVGPSNLFLGLPSPSSHTPPTEVDEVAIDASGQPATVSNSVTAASNTTPINITFTNLVGYTPSNGDILAVTSVLGNTGANGVWTLASVVVGGSSTTANLVGSVGTGAYTSGGTASIGQHLGLTEGPTQVSINPTLVEIRADQFESPIDAALTKVEAEIDMVLMEYNPRTLQRWFTADTLTNPAQTANTTLTTFGGQFTDADNLRTIMLISPDRVQVGRWIYVFAFRTYLKSAIQLSFHRSAHTSFKLKFGCVADFTRQPGDELLHFVRTKS